MIDFLRSQPPTCKTEDNNRELIEGNGFEQQFVKHKINFKTDTKFLKITCYK